jgi:hypothetical protein
MWLEPFKQYAVKVGLNFHFGEDRDRYVPREKPPRARR